MPGTLRSWPWGSVQASETPEAMSGRAPYTAPSYARRSPSISERNFLRILRILRRFMRFK